MTTIQSLKDFLPPFNHYLEIGPNFFIPIFVQKTKIPKKQNKYIFFGIKTKTEFLGGFVDIKWIKMKWAL